MGGWSESVQRQKGSREWWTMEASRETGDASSEPPYRCCWREIFLFSTLPLAFLPSFSLLVSLFFVFHSLIHFACALHGLPSFVSFLFISPTYCFPPLFPSLSSFINNLSYEFPYLPYIASVDLLSLIPSLTRIGSRASNRIPPSPVLMKINFYLASLFKAQVCSYFCLKCPYFLNTGAHYTFQCFGPVY